MTAEAEQTDMDIEIIDVEKSPAVASSSESNLPGSNNQICDTKLTTTLGLRSSLTDLVGIALAKTYPSQIEKTQEFALDFLCSQTHHPVVSCFRELTSSDLRVITGNNKLKKKLPGTLDQSVLYLSLIDYMAMTIDNALYTEKQKPIKNVPVKVQKVMLDFKNIIGSWGLSDLSKDRYEIVMKYLRGLAPHFKTIKFDETFSTILDTIDSEIARNKQKFDLLKSISVIPSSSNVNKTDGERKETDNDIYDPEDASEKAVLNSIDFNVSLNTEEIDEEEDTPSPPKTFFKLKPPKELQNQCPKHKLKKNLSHLNMKKSRVEEIKGQGEEDYLSQSSTDSAYFSPTSKPKSPKANEQKKIKAKNPKAPKSSRFPPLPDGTPDRSRYEVIGEWEPDSPLYPAYLEKMKKLKEKEEAASSKQAESIIKTPTENSSKNCEPLAKKPKLEAPIIVDETKKENQKTENTSIGTKPKINAFAFLMNRSKEIAEQKKQKKLSGQMAMTKNLGTVK